jgi:hypothetical protein
MENGVLAMVGTNHLGQLTLSLYCDDTIINHPDHPADDPIYLPVNVDLVGGVLRTDPMSRTRWTDCDPEWLNEHLDRIASKTLHRTLNDNPRCTLVRLEDALDLIGQLHVSQEQWRTS